MIVICFQGEQGWMVDIFLKYILRSDFLCERKFCLFMIVLSYFIGKKLKELGLLEL